MKYPTLQTKVRKHSIMFDPVFGRAPRTCFEQTCSQIDEIDGIIIKKIQGSAEVGTDKLSLLLHKHSAVYAINSACYI